MLILRVGVLCPRAHLHIAHVLQLLVFFARHSRSEFTENVSYRGRISNLCHGRMCRCLSDQSARQYRRVADHLCPCNNGTFPNRRCLAHSPNSRCISCSCPQVVCMAGLCIQLRMSKRRSECRQPQVCVSFQAIPPYQRSFSDAPAL